MVTSQTADFSQKILKLRNSVAFMTALFSNSVDY
jgi:hypothetical protein